LYYIIYTVEQQAAMNLAKNHQVPESVENLLINCGLLGFSRQTVLFWSWYPEFIIHHSVIECHIVSTALLNKPKSR
jgi:hypothetical protein